MEHCLAYIFFTLFPFPVAIWTRPFYDPLMPIGPQKNCETGEVCHQNSIKVSLSVLWTVSHWLPPPETLVLGDNTLFQTSPVLSPHFPAKPSVATSLYALISRLSFLSVLRAEPVPSLPTRSHFASHSLVCRKDVQVEVEGGAMMGCWGGDLSTTWVVGPDNLQSAFHSPVVWLYSLTGGGSCLPRPFYLVW